MKIKKQLVNAIFATAILAGTVGAWFSAGKNATVDGISVKMAEDNSGGIILNTSGMGGNPGEKITIEASALSLNPCTTADLISFFSVSNDTTEINGSTGAINGLSASCFSTVTGDTNYLEYWIYVKSIDNTTYTSFSVDSITLSGTGANDEINKALRIGVIFGDNAKIYAPVSGATDNYTSVDGNGALQAVTLAQYGQSFDSVSIGTSYNQIMIFAWYEGQDAACTTTNRKAVTGATNISISFTAG